MDPVHVCYILKRDTSGQKSVQPGRGAGPGGYSEMLKLLGVQHTSVSVPRGELLHLPSGSTTPPQSARGKSTQKFNLKRNPNISVSCKWENVAPLTLEECKALEGIPTPQDRFALFVGVKEKPPESQASGAVGTQQPTKTENGDISGRGDTHPTPPTSPQSGLTIGSVVSVPSFDPSQGGLYGVIRWIGQLPEVSGQIAGIELEVEKEGCLDGTCHQDGKRYFECSSGRGMYYLLHSLKPDDRTQDSTSTSEIENMQNNDTASIATANNQPKVPASGEQGDTRRVVTDTPTTEESDKIKTLEEENVLLQDKNSKLEQEILGVQEQARQQIQKALAEMEHRIQELDREKTTFQEECSELWERLSREEEKATLFEKELQMKQQELDEATLQLKRKEEEKMTLEKDLTTQKDTVSELEGQLEKLRSKKEQMQHNLVEANAEVQQARFLQLQASVRPLRSWRVPRNEVEKIRAIGGGAWGLVYEGRFKDQLVAIKEPHVAILCKNTNDRIEREIKIMAHVQHPNLVRFIAAVIDDKVESFQEPPMLITELLDINLRTAYNKYDLGVNRLPIFRDVAYALHYLHEHQEPIIHRDVSAPNILLEMIQEGVWKAKVSDFGSANLAKYSKTTAEGAIVYSAPETFPPRDPTAPLPKQTTKIDTFSYGILICEVITRKQPDPETRLEMLQNLETQWKLMYDLVISCTKEDPDCRPTMADILEKINTIPRPRFYKR